MIAHTIERGTPIPIARPVIGEAELDAMEGAKAAVRPAEDKWAAR